MKINGLLVSLTCLGLLGAQVLPAQDSSKKLGGEMVKHWQTSKELSLAVAEAMPEESYSFKATEGEMSFGQQMNHIAAANGSYCAAASQGKSPVSKPADDTKATAVKALTTSYDFCIEGLQGLSDADLQKSIQSKMGNITPFELFLGGFTHAAHHRGQAEVYLRLKNITPPAYKF